MRIVILIFLLVTIHMGGSDRMNKFKFTRCAGVDIFTCPGRKLHGQYNEMLRANCKNCDKYFHCQGNYEAVHGCQGNRTNNIRIAEKISNCREAAQSGDSADSYADQMANQFGRNGRNCAGEYLCKVKCKYNPKDRTCKKENCKD